MNNSECIVGVSPDASIGGIRLLDGPVTDLKESLSLSYNSENVDIYSSSWGPDDDGQTLDGPRELAQAVLKKGAEHGRHGLGNIFVWASGNGGKYFDSCAADGYCNSIYTITIASTTQFESYPWYSEKCASILTTVYSSGYENEAKIMTTDLGGQCSDKHTGTSAAAPVAAGVVALILEANSKLTWRDVQHIIVETSVPGPLLGTGKFLTNCTVRQIKKLNFLIMHSFNVLCMVLVKNSHTTTVSD